MDFIRKHLIQFNIFPLWYECEAVLNDFTQIYDKLLALLNFDAAIWYNKMFPFFREKKLTRKRQKYSTKSRSAVWHKRRCLARCFLFHYFEIVVLFVWPNNNTKQQTANWKYRKKAPTNQEKGRNDYERAWVVNQMNFIRTKYICMYIGICAIKIFDKILRHISWIAIYKT